MLKLGIFLAIGLSAGTASAADYSKQQSKAFCSEKWGTQYDMVKYCMDKQRDGHTSYKRRKNDLPTFGQYFTFCEQKWGVQWDMVEYCADKQVEGIDTVMSEIEDLPAQTAANILGECAEKWQNQLDMQGYCAGKRAAAWRAINQ